MAMQDGYRFFFQMNDKTEHDERLEYTLQYRFTSDRSNHSYIVRVERYRENTYCIKFYDKANTRTKNKFSLRTGTFEPRTIFYTLINIMLDVLKKDPKASFFFIGAEDEKDEPGKTTRRFRVYHRFVSSVVSENVFEHHRNNGLSLYILVNKKYVEDIPLYTQKITDFVSEAMNRE